MFNSYVSGPFPQYNNVPLSRVELTLSCSKLLDMDTFSKSDPQIFVYQQDVLTSKWYEIGRTEMIKDNLNPKFATPIVIDYRFEEKQNLRFLVVDVDKEGGKIEEQDIIGTVEISLAEIVGSRGQSVTQKIINPSPHKEGGFLTVKAEELNDMKMSVKISLEGKKLDKKDLFGRSDPFVRISKSRPDGQWAVVHKTEVIKNTLNPLWRPFSIPLDTLCNGNLDRELLFECYDWNRSGHEDFMGSFKTTLRELQSLGKVRGEIDLIDENKRRKKRNYRNSGTIRINCCDVINEPSFLDYIRGGCEINLMVAIDFTASNGDPKFPTSLHYNSPYKPNEYACAIKAVAEILAFYDTDKLFPTFGFGAKIPPRFNVSHCFPLNGNPNRPEVAGVDGILDAYNESLKNITLYGPTNFAEIIAKAASYAPHCDQNNQKYVILLIITDGEISDMQSTISQIVRASVLPLSIVIVGVGNDSFAKMVILDADEEPLRADGKVMARDIVQFVPFRDYKDAHPSRIAAVTLQEIPEQILSYFKSRNIRPNPPPLYQSNPPILHSPPIISPPLPSSSQSFGPFVQQPPLYTDPRLSPYPSSSSSFSDKQTPSQPFYQQPILQPSLSIDQTAQPIPQFVYQPIYVDQNGQPIQQQPFYQQPIYLPQQNPLPPPPSDHNNTSINNNNNNNTNNNNNINNTNNNTTNNGASPQGVHQSHQSSLSHQSSMYPPMMQMPTQPMIVLSPTGQPIFVQPQPPPHHPSNQQQPAGPQQQPIGGQYMGQPMVIQGQPGQPMQMMPQMMPMGQPMMGQPMMTPQGQFVMPNSQGSMVQMPVYVSQPQYGSQLPPQGAGQPSPQEGH